MNSEEFDTHGAHSTSVNTSRYVCPYTGLYRAAAGGGFAADSTGNRSARIHKNGSAVNGSTGPGVAGSVSSIVSAQTVTVSCNNGDYLELAFYQSSGGALATSTTADMYPYLNVEYLGTAS